MTVSLHRAILQCAQELDIKDFASINLGPKLIENITVLSFTFPWLSQVRVPPEYSTDPSLPSDYWKLL